jgi:hypothetical protein
MAILDLLSATVSGLTITGFVETSLIHHLLSKFVISEATKSLVGDFIFSYDLKSAYHHIEIFEEHQQCGFLKEKYDISYSLFSLLVILTKKIMSWKLVNISH